MDKRMLVWGLLVGVLCFTPEASFAEDYKIGVLSNRDAQQVIQQWKATADYLSEKVGEPFTIVPLEADQLAEWTKDSKVDFMLSSTAFYAQLQKLHPVQAITTLSRSYKDESLEQFGGVILVKRDSPILSLRDFKGKNFMGVKRASFEGWLIAHRLFLEDGIDPDKDFKSLRMGNAPENVVYAVLNAAVDGGTVRTGILEKMVEEGKVKKEDFRIIAQVRDSFPQAHSTSLYPEWPLAASSHVPESVREQVAMALLALSAADPPSRAANIAGWKRALDYSSVVECLKVTETEGLIE
ncbi:MAG: phosphate/phosphite/phosphonate ABC transporter substrate-binding protein [Syntrophobacteraceae bacterium]